MIDEQARRERLKDLFEAASELPPGDRGPFLDRMCGPDEELRRRLSHLLAHAEPSHDFLEEPLFRLGQLGAPSTEVLPLFSPDVLVDERFRVVRHLASGGMGEVYRARDLRLQRDVALKVVRHRMPREAQAAARLQQEGLAAARLNHPNIVTLHEVGRHEGHLYTVSELLDGENLRARLAAGALPAPTVLEWARQIASALDAAHGHGIIHRDLKPENVFITSDGRAKLLDFGLAKMMTAADTAGTPLGVVHTGPMVLLGTRRYMAPEQLRGEAVDQSADLYAFGLVLREMIDATPKRARLDRPGLSSGLGRIASRCTRERREDRYRSARDLLTALDRVQVEGRRRIVSLVAAAILLIAAVAAASRPVVDWVRRPSGSTAAVSRAQQTSMAIWPPLNLSGDQTTEQVGVGLVSTVAHNIATIPGVTLASQADAVRSVSVRRDPALTLRELGVAVVLALSLERAGNDFKLSARLHADGRVEPVWAGSYQGDPLAIQHGLLADVPRMLQAAGRSSSLTEAERERLMRLPTSSAAALRWYSEGRGILARPDAKMHADEAIAALTRAVDEDQAFVGALSALSHACLLRYETTRDPSWIDRAVAAAERALSIDASDPDVHIALGRIRQETGRTNDAVQELRLAVHLMPDSDDALRNLGRILAESGRPDEGAAELQRAIALRPNYWLNHYTLGFIRYLQGRYDKAIPSLVRVTELQPNYPGAWTMLGASYHRIGAMDRAVGHYEHAARVGRSASGYANLGLIYYIDRRYADALTAYRAAVDIEPSSPEGWRSMGDVYAKLGRQPDATGAYRKAVQLSEEQLQTNPRDLEALTTAAICNAKLGRREQADRRMSEAAAVGGDDRDVLYTRAVLSAIYGRGTEALAALRTALDHGYDRALARDDDEFDDLRGSSEFQKLVGGPADNGAR